MRHGWWTRVRDEMGDDASWIKSGFRHVHLNLGLVGSSPIKIAQKIRVNLVKVFEFYFQLKYGMIIFFYLY